MSCCRAILIGTILSLSGADSALSSDWIFDSGPYTRNPKTGQRVDQFKALPQIDRIPFEKFFSEDGPHPFGMDWYLGDWGFGGYGGGFGYGNMGFDWGGFGGFRRLGRAPLRRWLRRQLLYRSHELTAPRFRAGVSPPRCAGNRIQLQSAASKHDETTHQSLNRPKTHPNARRLDHRFRPML